MVDRCPDGRQRAGAVAGDSATNGWDDVFLTGEFGAYLEEEDVTITAVLKEIGLVE